MKSNLVSETQPVCWVWQSVVSRLMTEFGQAFCVKPYSNGKEVLWKLIINEDLRKESNQVGREICGRGRWNKDKEKVSL